MVIMGFLKTQGDFIMFGKCNTTFLKTGAILVCLAFTTVGFAANPNSARIIPTGKVSIIKDGEVVSEFSQEAPLPEARHMAESSCLSAFIVAIISLRAVFNHFQVVLVCHPQNIFHWRRLA